MFLYIHPGTASKLLSTKATLPLKYPVFIDSNPQLTEQLKLQNSNLALETRFLLPVVDPKAGMYQDLAMHFTLQSIPLTCSFSLILFIIFNVCKNSLLYSLMIWNTWILTTTTAKMQSHSNAQRIPSNTPLLSDPPPPRLGNYQLSFCASNLAFSRISHK